MAATPIIAQPAHITYPTTLREARHSARLWLCGTPFQTLYAWREARCHAHCDGLPGADARALAFRDEFNREIGALIAGGLCHE